MENINMINLSPYLAGPGVYIARNMLDVNQLLDLCWELESPAIKVITAQIIWMAAMVWT